MIFKENKIITIDIACNRNVLYVCNVTYVSMTFSQYLFDKSFSVVPFKVVLLLLLF